MLNLKPYYPKNTVLSVRFDFKVQNNNDFIVNEDYTANDGVNILIDSNNNSI